MNDTPASPATDKSYYKTVSYVGISDGRCCDVMTPSCSFHCCIAYVPSICLTVRIKKRNV